MFCLFFFVFCFFQAEDGIRDSPVTGVQTCALPICLHVHWGTLDAGVNRIQLDNDEGHQNSYVYDIVEVIDPHTLRLHMPAKVDDEVSYSIGRRSYGKFQVSNCEFFLLDTRGDRDMHDVQERGKPGVSMIGRHQREWLLQNMRESNADFFFVVSTVP